MMATLRGVFEGISSELERLLSETRGEVSCKKSRPATAEGRWMSSSDGEPTNVTISHLSGKPSQSLKTTPFLSANPPSSISAVERLVHLRSRYLAAADATAEFSAVYALASLCDLLCVVAVLMLYLVTPWKPTTFVVAAVGCQAVVFVVLFCCAGQWLEEAARRPVRLLLLSPRRSGWRQRLTGWRRWCRSCATGWECRRCAATTVT